MSASSRSRPGGASKVDCQCQKGGSAPLPNLPPGQGCAGKAGARSAAMSRLLRFVHALKAGARRRRAPERLSDTFPPRLAAEQGLERIEGGLEDPLADGLGQLAL